MTLAPGNGGRTIVDELEALSGRVDHAKRAAEARGRAVVTETRQGQATSPAPPGERRTLSRRPWRTGLIVALLLVLVGAAATVIASRSDGPGSLAANPAAAPNPTVAPSRSAVANPSSAAGTDVAATSPAVPAASAPTIGETGQLTTPAARSGPVAGTSPDVGKTVVVVAGDSFWSIAEHEVASVQGAAPTTAEVTGYWSQLVHANQGQLVHGGNPDLIYPGQTFSLP